MNMKLNGRSLAGIMATILAFGISATTAAAQDSFAWIDRVERETTAGQSWWENRVEIGTRITMYTLSDASRGADNHYLGSINTLKEDQSFMPTKIYANYWPREWIAVGLSYEEIRAETATVEEGITSYSDGTFKVNGPILSILAAWPNQTRFTPFAELGQMLMLGSFAADPAWANAHGISGYQDFAVTKEKGGTVLGAGCSVQLDSRLELDLLFRQIIASLMVDHVLLGNVTSHAREFPLDSTWFGVGLKYRF